MTGSSFRVNPETVLQTCAAVQAAADKVKASSELHRPNLRIDAFGNDPVSIDAAAAFTHRLQSYADYADAYARELQKAADAIKLAAMSYGCTEEDVERGFPPPAPSA